MVFEYAINTGAHMEKNNSLAAFLKQKRTEVGLSQKDVSVKLGYSTAQFVSNWERGVSNPPISSMKKISKVYNVSPEDLFQVALDSVIYKTTVDLRRRFNKSKSQ